MFKKIILPAVLGFIVLILIGVIGFQLLSNAGDKSKDSEGNIEIIRLDQQTKMETADYLVLNNTLYQKALVESKDLNEIVLQYQYGNVSEVELMNAITTVNKRLAYYYLVAVQTKANTQTNGLDKDWIYEFYLMRKGSEEFLKYNSDKSSLRLDVGRDLFNQAFAKEPNMNQRIATELVRYDINPDLVVLDQSVWEAEDKFLAQTPDMVIFKDLDLADKESFAYYLNYVNEAFMLVSWEVQNMYLAKIDFKNDQITEPQLNTELDASGYIISTTYDELEILNAPTGLEELESDTRKTMTLYRDALLEVQKFRMNGDLTHFDNAMVIINQADSEAGRIGEFIYAIKLQYGL